MRDRYNARIYSVSIPQHWAIKRRYPPLLMPAPHAVLAQSPLAQGVPGEDLSKSPASLPPVT
ncbi:hypothetical protein ACLK1T_08950 [Escherichia coli]